MLQQIVALAGQPQDVTAKLEQLRAKANELQLHASDLEGRRSQLKDRLDRFTGSEADRFALGKQVADAQHDALATQLQLETTKQQIDELQTQRDMSRIFALQSPPAKIATTAPPVARDPVRDFVLTDGFGLASFLLLFPFAVALARRVWMRSGPRANAVDLENSPRLHRIEQAIESIAVEVERIGEAQRFTTKLLADRQPDAVQRMAIQSRREPGTITPH
jgi:hypothetical protein